MEKKNVSHPPEIDKIADKLIFLAMMPLTVGIAFITGWLLSSDWGYLAGGIATIAIGAFILKVARNFRRLRLGLGQS